MEILKPKFGRESPIPSSRMIRWSWRTSSQRLQGQSPLGVRCSTLLSTTKVWKRKITCQSMVLLNETGSAGHVSQKHWFWSLRTIWVCYLSIRKKKKWLKLASAFRGPGKFSMYRLEGRWHEEILAKQVLVGGVEIQSRQHVTIALENVLRTQGLNVQCNMSSKYIF